MTEANDKPGEPIGVAGLDAITAGGLIRAGREKSGLHIAALAAAIKVSPRKLEALEADRYAELPDLTFTRALAHTVCRALKLDPEPVLAKLPAAGDLPKLAQVGGGLNAPFRGAPGSRDPGEFTLHRKPVFWATLLVLAGAAMLALVPDHWMPWMGQSKAVLGISPAAPASASVSSAAASATPLLPAQTVASAPALSLPLSLLPSLVPSAASAASPLGTVAPDAGEPVQSVPPSSAPPTIASNVTGVLSLRTTAESWIDVQDARGQTLLSRNVQRGESVGLDGALPLRVTIGNAAVTQLTFRGQPIDLSTNTRDNVARLQLP